MPDHDLLFVFDPDVGPTGIDGWRRRLASDDTAVHVHRFDTAVVVVAEGPGVQLPAPGPLPAPRATVRADRTFRLGRREVVPSGTVVGIGGVDVGDGGLAVFAGPCAVEDRDQMLATAVSVARHGAVGLRGGAFKPRTSPYSFQGLRWTGLELLAEARDRTGLPIVTEIVDPGHVERFADVVDAVQVGARNMQNFALLAELGRSRLPVVLKRGFAATIEETLGAAEYLLAGGNDQVVLCERGIRTFEPSTRFTLDLSAVALLKRRTHLPVMVDPSHAVGLPDLVEPLTLAAASAGADALLIDVHVRPEAALCDGKQALRPAEFGRLMDRLRMLTAGLGRAMARPSGMVDREVA